MVKALTVYLVYHELKSATINDSINQSIKNSKKIPLKKMQLRISENRSQGIDKFTWIKD